MKKQVAMKVAVIGLGSMGLRHALNLTELGVSVVGFDPLAERRAALEATGGRAVENREAALQGAAAAVIASPNAAHLSDLDAALGAGCHILVEKPLADTSIGLGALLSKAEAEKNIIFVAQNLRLHPAVARAKARLADGAAGEVLWARALAVSYLPHWRPGQDYRSNYAADPMTGGAVFDFIHEFDLLAHLLGPFTALAAVARHTGQLDIAAEDSVDALLRHTCGAVSSLHLDFATRPPRRVTEIGTSEGVLTIDILARTFDWCGLDGTVREYEAFHGQHADDYVAEMKCFLSCVAGEATPPCGGREGAAILDQVLALRRLAGLPERSSP